MKKRVLTIVLVIIAVAALLVSGFLLGYRQGRKFPETIIVKGATGLDDRKPGDIDFGVFWQAWQTINDYYLKNSDVSNQAKLHGSISGLVGSLGDPYTEFFAPEDNRKFQQDIQGNFGGIGAELGIKNNQLVVVAPLKDTPASQTGLQPNDRIMAINSSSTDGITIDKAVNLIRGPVGTDVTLMIMRDGWDKPKDFKITRANITIPTLDEEIVGGDIAHISLHQFNGNADVQFYEAAAKAISGRNKGIILDLRNNPGGYLEVAVDLAGWFLPQGTLVVKEEGRAIEAQEFKANGNAALKDLPVVVLINGGSASASEILAGALRDQRHVKLIGETSFGKGTVQQLEPLNDGSSIKLTVAHWILPGGQILENSGLEPDIEVKITDEDIAAKRDPQLQKAIEILQSEINR